VGELVVKLQDAFVRGDRLAVGRRMHRMNRAVRCFDGLCRRLGCHDDASMDEARQRILLRLYALAQRHATLPIEHPETFARQAAQWELRDLAREQRRLEISLDEHDPPSAVERSGKNAVDDLVAKIEAEQLLEEARRVFRAHVDEYARLAAESGRGRLGGQHVVAWWMLRVQGRPSEQVARELGVDRSTTAGRAVIWQWARRGRDAVLRIADVDADRERARVMRAATAAADGAPSSAALLR
jgi:hypothetical protein